MAGRVKGKCKYCGCEYTFSYMGKHLLTCEKRKKALAEEMGKSKCGYYQISVCGEYDRAYWMYLEMPETAKLSDLDKFFRDIWLECCGHLSAFYIDDETYEIMPDTDDFLDKPAKSMNYKLEDILKKGMKIGYEYDFGSPTELQISVLDYLTEPKRRGKVILLSRNNLIHHTCSECNKKEATCLDVSRIWEGDDPFLCDKCAEEYGDDDYIMSVCNSPRMGVCGYEGSTKYPEEFEPDRK